MPKNRELKIDAVTDNLQTVMDFTDMFLEELDCPMKAQMQLDIAVEELFVNIAHYAYAPETGMVRKENPADFSMSVAFERIKRSTVVSATMPM